MRDRLFALLKVGGDERPEIVEVRQRFFDQVFYPFLVLGFFAVVLGCLNALKDRQWVYAILYGGSYAAFLLTAHPRAGYSLVMRSAGLIFALFVIAVLALIRIGLSGVGLELIIMACALSSAILGKRAGFILVAAGVVAATIIGAGMVAGFIPVHLEPMMTSVSVLAWATSLVVATMVCLGVVMIPQMFLSSLTRILDASRGKDG